MFSSPTPCLRIWSRPSLLCDSSSHVICDVWFRNSLNQTSYIPCSFHIHWTSSSDVRLVRVIHPSSPLWSYSLVILASVSHSLVKQALVIHLWYRAVAFHLCFSFRCFKFQHISPLVTFTGIRRWDLRSLIWARLRSIIAVRFVDPKESHNRLGEGRVHRLGFRQGANGIRDIIRILQTENNMNRYD